MRGECRGRMISQCRVVVPIGAQRAACGKRQRCRGFVSPASGKVLVPVSANETPSSTVAGADWFYARLVQFSFVLSGRGESHFDGSPGVAPAETPGCGRMPHLQ